MKKQILITNNDVEILDLGCGRGAKIPVLQKRGKVTGIDISSEFINNCQQLFPNSKFIVMDGLKLNFPKQTFEQVYCLDVIEHVNNPDLLLKNIKSVLKPKGHLFLDIPYYQSEKLLTTFNPSYPQEVHHQTVFTYKKIIALLNKYHFKITSSTFGKFADNLYLLSYFLQDKHIQNQQVDFIQETDLEKLLSFTIQHLYDNNLVKNIVTHPNFVLYNQISLSNFKLPVDELLFNIQFIDKLISPFFPKTISLKCQISPNTTNKLIDIKPKQSINLSKYSPKRHISKYKTKIKKITIEKKLLNNKIHQLSSELEIIKHSQFFKLWPAYNKIKSIIK